MCRGTTQTFLCGWDKSGTLWTELRVHIHYYCSAFCCIIIPHLIFPVFHNLLHTGSFLPANTKSQQRSPLRFASSPTLPTHPPTAGLWGWAVSISVFSSVCLYKASSIMQRPPTPLPYGGSRLSYSLLLLGRIKLAKSQPSWYSRSFETGRRLWKVKTKHIWTQENSPQ